MKHERLKQIIEGALLAAGRPLGIDQLLALFLDEEQPSRDEIREALTALQEECAERGIELKEVSTGFRYQVKSDYAEWVGRLWEEKPAKYSRAVLETLALIAYRQPITRAEIEDVRGVSVSSHIVKSLMEREWIRIVGHRDVPGKPALFGTTRMFLDYFNLTSLSDLPPLAEIRSIESIEHELDFGNELPPQAVAGEEAESAESAESAENAESQETLLDDASDEVGVEEEQVVVDERHAEQIAAETAYVEKALEEAPEERLSVIDTDTPEADIVENEGTDSESDDESEERAAADSVASAD